MPGPCLFNSIRSTDTQQDVCVWLASGISHEGKLQWTSVVVTGPEGNPEPSGEEAVLKGPGSSARF